MGGEVNSGEKDEKVESGVGRRRRKGRWEEEREKRGEVGKSCVLTPP